MTKAGPGFYGDSITFAVAHDSGLCAHCKQRITVGAAHLMTRRGGAWIHTDCDDAALNARVGLTYAWELQTA